MVEEEVNETEENSTDHIDKEIVENTKLGYVLEINPEEFNYDPVSDTVKPKDKKALTTLLSSIQLSIYLKEEIIVIRMWLV